MNLGGGIGTLLGCFYSIISKPIKDQINELTKETVSYEEIEKFKTDFEDLKLQKSIDKYIEEQKKILKNFEKKEEE